MKSENVKPFDSVATMRRIRDRLSKRFAGMSFAEQKSYIEKRSEPKPAHARTTNLHKRIT